ncbi:MAG TPA: hypothetical protein EYN91_17800 [Candidatus Melainabacteria bacterium]|nr:hypothetical protein [Candidatus Melainabacteria bacterium]HIN65275.1 hypothetical protein [Candidatus Obscuribacterales bacterium]
MAQQESDGGNTSRKKDNAQIAQIREGSVAGLDSPESEYEVNGIIEAIQDTWSGQNKPLFTDRQKSLKELFEIYDRSLEHEKMYSQSLESIKEFNLLSEMRSKIFVADENRDGNLSRKELKREIDDLSENSYRTGDAENYVLQNFAKISGGSDTTTAKDLERAALSSLTRAIQAASKSSVGPELRSAIVEWEGNIFHNPEDAKKAQDTLNKALEGTGIKANIEISKFKNYLDEEVPLSTFTLTHNGKTLDQFSYMSGIDAYRSLIDGQSHRAREIFDTADPTKMYSPEMTKQLQETKALRELFDFAEIKDGNITFKDAENTKDETNGQRYARKYLQNNFAKLAVMDGDPGSVSREDLRNAMIDSLAALSASSVARYGLKTSSLVEDMLRTALLDRFVGASRKFEDTLNAALQKKGYRAEISARELNRVRDYPYLERREDSTFLRNISIYKENDPANKKDIGIMIRPQSSRDRINRTKPVPFMR